MLSKCLNPQCTAKFRYLWEGRLFRIDFSEVKRRESAHAGMPVLCTIDNPGKPAEGLPEPPQKERPSEHFWLCATCATSLTIAVSDAGEVQVVKLPPPEPVATETPGRKLVAAS